MIPIEIVNHFRAHAEPSRRLASPSGLNRAFPIGKLTDAYRELFEAGPSVVDR